MKQSGVYALCDVSGAIRYIGQSVDVDRRIVEHRRAAKIEFDHVLLLERAPGVSWMLHALEREWIRYGRSLGWQLTNLTKGGNAGGAWSTESRQKLSVQRLGKLNPMYGRPSPTKGTKASAATRAKLSAVMMGRPAWNKGIPATLEARAAISAGRRGLKTQAGLIKPGTRFVRLVVIEHASGGGAGEKRRYLCRCDCGKEVETVGTSLTKGATRSCGCLRREVVSAIQKERHRRNRLARQNLEDPPARKVLLNNKGKAV